MPTYLIYKYIFFHVELRFDLIFFPAVSDPRKIFPGPYAWSWGEIS